jgi:hypothetical protein
MLGVVSSGQVADSVSVTTVPAQASVPVAVTVLLTEHVSAGAVKVAEKLADTPGARLGTVNTVTGTDLSLETTTLFSVTLPEFLTVPVKVIGPPAAAGTVGQTSVTAMLGAVATPQVITAEFCTGVPVQVSRPVADTVVVTEQSVAGTV